MSLELAVRRPWCKFMRLDLPRTIWSYLQLMKLIASLSGQLGSRRYCLLNSKINFSGQSCRPCFDKLGGLRALTYMALTATAFKETQEAITKSLHVSNPVVVSQPLYHPNIYFSAKPMKAAKLLMPWCTSNPQELLHTETAELQELTHMCAMHDRKHQRPLICILY